MNNSVQVNLLDPEDNTIYPILLNPIDARRCETDIEFAQSLIKYAQREAQRQRQQEPLETEWEETDVTPHEDPLQSIEVKDTQSPWSYNETLALISAYDTHKENFNVAKKRKFVWQDIANELVSNGIEKNAEKCEIKWRNLLRTYKHVKDIQESSGRGAGKFRFFSQLDEILGDKPSMSSPHTFSSTSTDVNKNRSEIFDDETQNRAQNLNKTETEKRDCNDQTTQKNCTKRKRVLKLDESIKKKSEDLINIKINYLKKKEEDEKKKELRRNKKIELKEKMVEIEQKKNALFEKFLEKEYQK